MVKVRPAQCSDTPFVSSRIQVQQGIPVVTKSDTLAHDVDDIFNVFNFELSAGEMQRLGEIK